MNNVHKPQKPPDRASDTPPPGPREAGSPDPPPALSARGLTVVRGSRTVLDDLSFDVAPATVTGLLGPSGSGKSTLIRAVVGTQAKVTGTLDVLGAPAGSRPLRSRLGYVTQAPSVYADLSARQNLDYFAAVLGIPRRDRARAVTQALADVDLTSHADDLSGNLSGGQRSRVSLAVALLGAPELLVLDEPTVGLDPVLRRDLWDLFHHLAADRGTTLLISSHVMDEADRCEHLLLVRGGTLLASDAPDALRARTGTDTIEDAFLKLVESVESTSPELPGDPRQSGASRQPAEQHPETGTDTDPRDHHPRGTP